MDELLTTGELAAGQLDLSLDNAQLYTEYRRLAAEQAALRRLATLVARGVEPSEVFDAVVNEMRRCVSAQTAGLWRYESSGEITKVAAVYHSLSAAGEVARGHVEPRSTATPWQRMVQRTGGPRGWTAMRTAPVRSPHESVRWACARRWACQSSSMDACGAWRPWVRLNPGLCRPTPRSASAASPN